MKEDRVISALDKIVRATEFPDPNEVKEIVADMLIGMNQKAKVQVLQLANTVETKKRELEDLKIAKNSTEVLLEDSKRTSESWQIQYLASKNAVNKLQEENCELRKTVDSLQKMVKASEAENLELKMNNDAKKRLDSLGKRLKATEAENLELKVQNRMLQSPLRISKDSEELREVKEQLKKSEQLVWKLTDERDSGQKQLVELLKEYDNLTKEHAKIVNELKSENEALRSEKNESGIPNDEFVTSMNDKANKSQQHATNSGDSKNTDMRDNYQKNDPFNTPSAQLSNAPCVLDNETNYALDEMDKGSHNASSFNRKRKAPEDNSKTLCPSFATSTPILHHQPSFGFEPSPMVDLTTNTSFAPIPIAQPTPLNKPKFAIERGEMCTVFKFDFPHVEDIKHIVEVEFAPNSAARGQYKQEIIKRDYSLSDTQQQVVPPPSSYESRKIPVNNKTIVDDSFMQPDEVLMPAPKRPCMANRKTPVVNSASAINEISVQDVEYIAGPVPEMQNARTVPEIQNARTVPEMQKEGCHAKNQFKYQILKDIMTDSLIDESRNEYVENVTNKITNIMTNMHLLFEKPRYFEDGKQVLITELINLQYPHGVTRALEVIVSYLSVRRNDPICLYKETGNPDVLLPIDEKCTIEAFYEADKQHQCDFQDRLVNMISDAIFEKIGQPDDLKIFGISALCRVYTAIHKSKERAEQVIVLTYKLLKFRGSIAPFLIASIAGVWREAVDTGVKDNEGSFFLKVLRCLLTHKPEKMKDNIWQSTLHFFTRFYKLDVSKEETDEIAVNVIEHINANSGEDEFQDQMAFNCTLCLELLAARHSWTWDSDLLQYSIIPYVQLYMENRDPKHNSAVAVYFTFLGALVDLCGVQDIEKFHNFVGVCAHSMLKGNVKVPFFVMEATCVSYFRLSQRLEKELYPELYEWLHVNRDNLSEEKRAFIPL